MTVILEGSTPRYLGLAADTKPTAPPAGSLFYETDSGLTYIYDGSAWVTAALQGGLIRHARAVTLTIADNAAVSGALDLRGYAGGMVLLPSAWVAANCGFLVSDSLAGTYSILRDDVGVPVQISGISTSAARWYKLPDALFAAHFIELWSKSTTVATETDISQTGGPLTITVLLKG